MRARGTTAAVATTAAAGLLLLGGCTAGGGAEAGATASAPASRTPRPAITDLITPSPTPSAPATAEPVGTVVDAGPVGEGVPATVSGTGPADVSFQRQGEFAVVLSLDCSACTGTAIVTAAGRMTPFGEAAAPMTGSFLTGIFRDDPVEQQVIVRADGPWTLGLQSWNDLATVSGAQSGTGPAVLFFSDDVPRVTVDYTPAGPDDSFSGRVFTTSDQPQLFGDSVAFSEVFEADLPGVMAVQTEGTWTVTPTP
ncbi:MULTISPECIES: hypothetical protein [unclassified Rathayibacter]|uniref:hypothetical protein n=1 Tax=unclassified Rathayibacter TaxID=2609250 RepID=UPI0011AFD7AC|nr:MULTISPECIES: hypothetical protein [unclassified Rathayibacter]